MAKAFDKVNHDLLLLKLRSVGACLLTGVKMVFELLVTCIAAASRQWWKVSNPPEVASHLVCHKAPFLDLCSFSYITVTFHQ